MPIISKQISKQMGEPPVKILTDISLEIQDGDFIALTGRSGSGKSTLLYLLSTLDSCTTGTVEIEGHHVEKMDRKELHHFRNQKMGFIFQFHYLLGELTALENVLMPTRKLNLETQRTKYARMLLDRFELSDKTNRFPRQLSGGEQQRVAIARALVMEPKYLFADEPTGSLDSINGDLVMNIIQDINKQGTTVIMVTHDPDFANLAKRKIHLIDGKMQ